MSIPTSRQRVRRVAKNADMSKSVESSKREFNLGDEQLSLAFETGSSNEYLYGRNAAAKGCLPLSVRPGPTSQDLMFC